MWKLIFRTHFYSISYNRSFFSWNKLFSSLHSNFFSKNVAFIEFLFKKCVSVDFRNFHNVKQKYIVKALQWNWNKFGTEFHSKYHDQQTQHSTVLCVIFDRVFTKFSPKMCDSKFLQFETVTLRCCICIQSLSMIVLQVL